MRKRLRAQVNPINASETPQTPQAPLRELQGIQCCLAFDPRHEGGCFDMIKITQ